MANSADKLKLRHAGEWAMLMAQGCDAVDIEHKELPLSVAYRIDYGSEGDEYTPDYKPRLDICGVFLEGFDILDLLSPADLEAIEISLLLTELAR